jgi:DNA polymerase-3 subunit delta
VRRSTPLGLPDGNKGGAFFLYGDDHFRKEEAGKALVEWHLDPATRDFNFDPLRGSEVDVESMASVLGTPPMMAEWRVVVLREVEGLASSPRAREALLTIVKRPPPGLALVILGTIPSGSKAKFYRDLIRFARAVEFAEIGVNDVPGWLVERARDHHGVEITMDAARALAGGLGTDLGVLVREVEKLASMVERGQAITPALVEKGGTRVPAQDRWEWMDMVGGRDFRKALDALPTLLAQGESAVYLTMGLTTHFLRLGVGCTGGRGALEEVLLPHQRKWLAASLMEQARRWTVTELESAVKGLKRVDRILKSSTLPQEQVLEEWILGHLAREAGETQ